MSVNDVRVHLPVAGSGEPPGETPSAVSTGG